MKHHVVFVILLTSIFGCSTTPPVDESLGEDTISAVTMGCKKPYALPQDCSVWSGATRSIEIEEFPIKIAGSELGDVVFVMDANALENAFKEALTLNLAEDYKTVAANNSFEAVQKVFAKDQVKITRVRPVVNLGRVTGYVLELDSDGYAILKAFSVD